MGGQERDVLGPLAQRRQVDLDHVEPVKEVFAELPLLDLLLQERLVAATTRTSTSMLSVPPTRSNRRSWSTPQQLGLHRLRDVADLVEEDRAAVGQLEAAPCAG